MEISLLSVDLFLDIFRIVILEYQSRIVLMMNQ